MADLIYKFAILTLFAPGGPPCRVVAYDWANTRTSVLKKLDFSQYEFRKGHYAFYPIKMSRFGEKMKYLRNTKIS